MPDYETPEFIEKVAPVNTPLLTVIESFQHLPLDFQPGDEFRYSNSGYNVLGLVIEKISGMPYDQFLQHNIFEPLGMKDSGYDWNTTILPRRASGYDPGPDGFSNVPYARTSVWHAAGALYSTTNDLLRWEQALFGGKLLMAASLAKMTTPFKDDYALGLFIRTGSIRKTIDHSGWVPGFVTFLTYYPETKVVVAVLSNVDSNALGPIVGQLGAVAHGDLVKLLSERKAIRLPVGILSRYTGAYETADGIVFKVVAGENGELSIQPSRGASQGPLSALIAESESSFFISPQNVDVEFTIDASGKVTAMKVRPLDRDLLARRVADQ